MYTCMDSGYYSMLEDVEGMATTALELIKSIGYGELAEFDGCACSEVQIKGINVDVHCWRTSRRECTCPGIGIHVVCYNDLHSREELQAIGEEVKRQLHEFWPMSEPTIVLETDN